MTGLVKIEDFMDHLTKNNLVIVHKADYLIASDNKEFELKQNELMQEDALKVSTIKKYKLLPQGTLGGIKKNLIKNGLPGEFYKNADGVWMVCTTAIKRLNKETE